MQGKIMMLIVGVLAGCVGFAAAGRAEVAHATAQPRGRVVSMASTTIDQKIFLFRCYEDGTVERRVIHPSEHRDWSTASAWTPLDTGVQPVH
jgi:hypothetical protein